MKGLALSYNKEAKYMPKTALVLGKMDGGHNKFLESMMVWMEVDAPLDFHIQLDTYRVGITKQSESTMHTLGHRKLLQEDFEINIPATYLTYLNSCIDRGIDKLKLKKLLPCGFLQMRMLCVNYKTIRNIILQRRNHKLPEWRVFCEVMKELKYYKYMGIDDGNE